MSEREDVENSISEEISIKKTHFLRWILTLFTPLICFVFLFIYFKQVYLFYFEHMDSTYTFGYILESPITYSLTMLTFTMMLPRYKNFFTILVTIILCALKFSSFMRTLLFMYEFNPQRYWENLFSDSLTIAILIFIAFIRVKFDKK